LAKDSLTSAWDTAPGKPRKKKRGQKFWNSFSVTNRAKRTEPTQGLSGKGFPLHEGGLKKKGDWQGNITKKIKANSINTAKKVGRQRVYGAIRHTQRGQLHARPFMRGRAGREGGVVKVLLNTVPDTLLEHGPLGTYTEVSKPAMRGVSGKKTAGRFALRGHGVHVKKRNEAVVRAATEHWEEKSNRTRGGNRKDGGRLPTTKVLPRW